MFYKKNNANNVFCYIYYRIVQEVQKNSKARLIQIS